MAPPSSPVNPLRARWGRGLKPPSCPLEEPPWGPETSGWPCGGCAPWASRLLRTGLLVPRPGPGPQARSWVSSPGRLGWPCSCPGDFFPGALGWKSPRFFRTPSLYPAARRPHGSGCGDTHRSRPEKG